MKLIPRKSEVLRPDGLVKVRHSHRNPLRLISAQLAEISSLIKPLEATMAKSPNEAAAGP